MTVRLITTIQFFQGVSTDIKPTDPPEGSTFHAIDTGEQYVFHNGGWEQDIRMITALRAV